MTIITPPRPSQSSWSPLSGQGHLQAFLDYLQAECGLAINTRKAYRRDLTKFLVHIRGTDLARLTAQQVSDFLRACKQQGLSVASICRALAAVRTFCRYLVLQRILDRDVSSTIDTPKKWNRLPTVIDDQSARNLMAAPSDRQDSLAIRDRAMLALLYATGMRAAELAGLRLADVNFNLGVLRVMGKGSKERIVPVAQDALELVRRYLPDRSCAGEAKSPELFLSRSGRPLAREDVFRTVRKYVRRAGLRGNVSPHTLRHCFATELLGHGADLRSVQEMLGHANIATTEIYTHVDAQRLRAIHRKFHPRA